MTDDNFARLSSRVIFVIKNERKRVIKNGLRFFKTDTVLFLIISVFG